MKIQKLILFLLVMGLAIGLSRSPSLAREKAGTGESAAEQQSDSWLKAKLITTYTLNPHLNPFDINVDIKEGVVSLAGKVESSVERDLAVEIAKGMAGVKEVQNQLVIESEARSSQGEKQSFSQMVNDATITAKVKSRLLWNRNTEGLEIDVDTAHGEVVLRGRTESAVKRDLAVRIAKNTSGVKKVVDKLQVSGAKEPGKTEGTAEKIKKEVSDAWITGKVKAILLSSKEAEGAEVEVSTRDKVVTLKGTVLNQKQQEKIISLAADVVGVAEVKSNLTIMAE